MATGGKGTKEQVPKIVTEKTSPRRFIRPVERQRMRPWLIEHLEANDIPGLMWQSQRDRTFRISWKHAANQGFSMEKDTNLFERWAIHTGRHYDSDHKRWKANFRCALNSLPDVSELKDQGIKKGSNAFKVYKFLTEKEVKSVKAVFKKRRVYNYKVIHLKRDVEEDTESGSDVDTAGKGGSEDDTEKDSEGDHNYAEYNLRLGHLQSGSAVTPNLPSLPLLDELDSPSGVDLLLKAGSSESKNVKPLSGSPGFSSLKQILKAATESFSTKQSKESSEDAGRDALSKHMSQLCAESKIKVEHCEKSEEEEKSSAAYGFRCIWCERVWTTKVELFQHFLMDHQDRLLASTLESTDTSTDDKPDPKLQKEIAALEKSVLSNYKAETETVIEDGEVLDLSINNDLSNKDMYIEEQALDLTVKKAAQKDSGQDLLDLANYRNISKRTYRQNSKTSGKGKRAKGQKGQKSSGKRSKKLDQEEDIELSCDDIDEEEDDDGEGSSSGSHGDMSRQHSREDFLHAEMLLSLKSCVGSQGDGASREGSPELGKRSSGKKNQKRKRGSKESYEGAKLSKTDEYMKNLDKIIKKVDRRVAKGGKVIVESVESEANQETGTALQKQWEEQLFAFSKSNEIPGTEVHTAHEEDSKADLNVEASKKLKEVRGMTKAISDAQKESANIDSLDNDMKAEAQHEDLDQSRPEKKGDQIGDKSALETLLEASMMSLPYKCIVCGLGYTLKDDLEAHLKTHCDYLPFKCGICGLTFEKVAFLLRNHMKIHMHNHRYVCDKCAAEFSVPFQLMQHLEVHKNEEKSKAGNSKSAESSRSENVEKAKKEYLSPFVCNLCDTSMSYGQELSSHVRRHFQGQIHWEKLSGSKERNFMKKAFVDAAVETEKDGTAAKPEGTTKAGAQEMVKTDSKQSILAEVLQSAPKYASNLVVDKATGAIYHITNLPTSVKEYQALSDVGIKQEQKQDVSNSMKDSQTNDSFNVSKVVHVSTPNSSGNVPILIRKSSNTKSYIIQSGNEQVGNISEKVDTQFAFKESADDEKNNQTGLDLENLKIKSTVVSQEKDPHPLVLNMNSQSAQRTSPSAENFITQPVSTEVLVVLPPAPSSQLSSKTETVVTSGSSHPLTQISVSQQSTQGAILQPVLHNGVAQLATSTVNQAAKEAIIQLTLGNVTQFVKVALPQSPPSTLVKLLQETESNKAQGNLNPVLQSALALSAQRATVQNVQEPTSEVLHASSTQLVQTPTFQIVQGASAQPVKTSIAVAVHDTRFQSAAGATAQLNHSQVKETSDPIPQVAQGILLQALDGTGILPSQNALSQQFHGDVAVPCLLQAVSVGNNNTAMSLPLQVIPSSGIKPATNEPVEASVSSCQSLKILDVPDAKEKTEAVTSGSNIEMNPVQLTAEDRDLKISVLGQDRNGNQSVISALLASSSLGQSLRSSPVIGSSHLITPVKQEYETGSHTVRTEANIANATQPVYATGLQVSSRIMAFQESDTSNPMQTPEDNKEKLKNASKIGHTTFSNSQTTDSPSNHLGMATASFLQNPLAHKLSAEKSVTSSVQSNTLLTFLTSPSEARKHVNTVLSVPVLSTVTNRTSTPQTVAMVPGVNESTDAQIQSKIKNTPPCPPPTTISTVEIPKLIAESLKAKSQTLHMASGKVSATLAPMAGCDQNLKNRLTQSSTGFTQTVYELGKKVPLTNTTEKTASQSGLNTNAMGTIHTTLGGPSSVFSTTHAVTTSANLPLSPFIYNIQSAVSTGTSTNSKVTTQMSSKVSGAQFSLPLIIRTSTGGGIATVQVGDKVYPLGLVFSQPLVSSQAAIPGNIMVSSTTGQPSASIASVAMSSLSSNATSAPSADSNSNVSLASFSNPSSFITGLHVDSPKVVSIAKPLISDSPQLSVETLEIDATASDSGSVTKSTALVESTSVESTGSSSCTQISEKTNSSTTSSLSVTNNLYWTASCSSLSSKDSSEKSRTDSVEHEDLWLCSLCSCFFVSSKVLHEHISTHKSAKEHIYKCDHCEALFYDGTQMRQHNLTHFLSVRKEPSKYKCPRCDVEFSFGNQLKCHCKWAHKDDTFPCPHCDEIFIQKVALQAHSFHHPYCCKICGARFDSRKDVEEHVILHQGSPYVSSLIETKTDLKHHLVPKKTKYKKFKYGSACKVCNLTFSSKKKYITHIQIHFSRSVVFCGICRLAFLGAEDAKNHLFTHETPLACKHCSETFQDSKQMAAHTHEITSDCLENQVLASNETTVLGVRDTVVDNETKAAKHTLEHTATEKPIRNQSSEKHKDNEDIVPKSQVVHAHAFSQSGLKREIKTERESVSEGQQKSFVCSICDVTLPSCFKLKQHKVMAHFYPRTNRNISYYQHIIENIKRPRIYSCKLCNKSFDLQSTLLWHLRFHYDRHYFCRLCKIKFDSKAKLIAHGKVHVFSKPAESVKETDEIVNKKDSTVKDIQIENVQDIDNDSDDMGHTNSEDGLQIDEENDDLKNTSSETSSISDKQISTVKERLAEKCQKRKSKVVKPKTSIGEENDTSKNRKQQRKKVFGCGICKKSYFKLMKLTKHVWEHEQFEDQSQVPIATDEKETGENKTDESECKNKNSEGLGEIKSDGVEKQKADHENDAADIKARTEKMEKYMCSLCKIKYYDSADLFKHAKIHLGQAEIAALVRRKQKHAAVVTGDPSKVPVYIELDESGNLVRRTPVKVDQNEDKTQETNTSDMEKRDSQNKESVTVQSDLS